MQSNVVAQRLDLQSLLTGQSKSQDRVRVEIALLHARQSVPGLPRATSQVALIKIIITPSELQALHPCRVAAPASRCLLDPL